MKNAEEEQLVDRCKAGDRGALKVLYEAHHKKIYAMALRMTGSVADAEDVTQDTFIRAFVKIGKFRGDSAVGTWLCRIAINLSRDLYKKKSRIRPEAELDRPVLQNATARDALTVKRLERALLTLPGGYREVLVLHDVMGLRHAEIASVLDISQGTSKSQLHKARARMRECLGQEVSTS